MRKFIIHIVISLSLVVASQFQLVAQGAAPVGVTITVNFDTPPTPSTLSVEQAPLKYNKDFALSMQMDDTDDDIYDVGFPVFTGGSYGGAQYSGFYYSDGCGNLHSFKMSAAVFIYDGITLNGMDKDVLNPDNNNDDKLKWAELDILYQNGWGVQNHSINGSGTGSVNYSINRNKSYVRRNLYNSTYGGVVSHSFVNPAGNLSFTSIAFDNGYISALNQGGNLTIGNDGGDVNNYNIDWTLPLEIGRQFVANASTFADDLASLSTGGANYWGTVYTHNLSGRGGGISTSVFEDNFTAISNTYGINDLDNILMTTDEEIQDYLIVRDATEIATTLNGSVLEFTFTGNVPDDLLYYSSTILINSDANINSIIVTGAESYTDTIKNNTDALININWDGYYVIPPEVLGDSMVTIASASQHEYDCWIAMDYVITMTNGSHKDSLREVLCAIPNVDYDDGFCNCEINLSQTVIDIIQDSCITLIGPVGDYTYEWSVLDSIIVDTLKDHETCPADSMQFNLVATNPYGCPSFDSIIVNIHGLNINLGDDIEICLGDSDTIKGPTGMAEYQWYLNNVPGGQDDQIIVTPTESKICRLIVVDQHGLTDTDTLTITLLLLPEADINPQDTILILGDTIELSGSYNSVYNYYWSEEGDSISIDSSINISPSETTLYNLLVTDYHGCSSDNSTLVTVHWVDLNLNQLNQDTVICMGDSTMLVGPADMDSYNWYKGQTLIDTIRNTYVNPVNSEYFYLEIVDTIGALAKDSIQITVNPKPILDLGLTETLIILGDSIALNGSIDATSWIWYEGEYLISNDTNIVRWPLNMTQYKQVATNDFGCFSSDSITVIVHSYTLNLIQDTVSICNGDSALLTGPTNMSNYSWYCEGDTLGADSLYYANPNITSCYYLKVSDTIGASDIDSIRVEVNPMPDVNIQQPDFTINLGASETIFGPSGFSTYNWFENGIHTDTTQNTIVSPLSDSEYILYATNQYSCEGSDTINVNVLVLTVDLGPDTAICHGNCVYLEGPSDMLSYTWFEDGIYYSSNPSIEPCPTDTTEYSLFVIDQFSVSDWDSIQINVWPTPVVEIHPSNTTISLGDSVELFGAIGNYTWVWDSLGVQIGTSQNITVCPIDTTQYNHIATNIYGCYGEDSTFVYINFLSFDLGPDRTICEGDSVTISGPDDMVEYEWTVADTLFSSVQTITTWPIDTTQYTLWVEDSLGATASDSIVVNVLPTPVVNLHPVDSTINEKSCIDLFGEESEGYTYVWSIGDSTLSEITSSINTCPPDTTQFNLIITNTYDCSAQDSTMVFIEYLSFDLGPDQTICENSCFEIVGPDGMVEYEWKVADTIYSTDQTIIPCPLEETEYALWVKDEYGATASDSIVLSLKPNPIVDFEDDSLYVSLGNDILITVNFDVFSGQPFFTWLYNDESKVTFTDNYYNLINPDTSDYVYVELQADNMCTAVDSAYLTVLEFPEITVSNDTAVCGNQPVTLKVSGGELFLWIVDNDTISHDSVITVSPEVSTIYIAQTAFANSTNYSADTVIVTIFNSTDTKILYDTNTVCTYAEIELTASGAEHYMWVPSEDTNDIYIFSIIDTTTISLIGTNDDGCISIDSTTFYNIPAPIVSFTGLLPVFCENDSYVTLIGVPDGGIYSGEGIVDDRFYPQNTEAGIYEIVYEYINTENCIGYDTNSTIIYGNGGSIDLGSDFILKYDSSKLLDAGAGFDSYLWTTGARTQSITVHGNEKSPGIHEYAVMGVINGCSTRGDVNITFEKPDGVSEQHISGLSIFPNPNRGNFTVKFSSIEKNIKLKIYSVQGLLIYELNDISCAEDCTVDIQLNNVEPGFYFIKIITPYGISTDKIILK